MFGSSLNGSGGMKMRNACIFVFAALLLIGYSGAWPEDSAPPQYSERSAEKRDPAPEEIIQRFTEKETEFYKAWMQYTYTQIATIKVVEENGIALKNPERLIIISEVVFNDDGTREVQIKQQRGRLKSVYFTDEDKEVISNLNPFALTKEELPLYKLKYEGKERVDELDCYVFSVKPKKVRGDRFYFEGKIWVDDLDLQVVRTIGKPIPQRENKFPEFETLRQVIDGKYWFPVWTHADSELRFSYNTVRVQETITYENYMKFSSDATIQFGKPIPLFLK
jgi:hypothetical protein